MSSLLLPYDTIVKAHEGDPKAIQAVLDRYAGYIRYFSKMNGYYNSDMEDYIRTKLIESLLKFRLGCEEKSRINDTYVIISKIKEKLNKLYLYF